ncbi:MAG: GEVED domain-containing protein [Phaeodactylibacter xiamenensis]|nr:GEVED domain-containing protein [Phaeodactylibacter xiamenensis]MCR9054015.1 GEVED domain-containing protein [bacterium]
MKRIAFHFLFGCVFTLCPLFLLAQPDGGCGAEPTVSSIAIMDSLQKEVDAYVAQYFSGEVLAPQASVPVQVHIIRRTNGTGGLSISAWNNALNNLNSLYTGANLNFFECSPPNIINSNTYFDLNQSEEGALHSLHGVSNVLNIYIPGGDLISSSGGSLCGYAYFPFGGSPDLIVVKSSCMTSGNTFAHEIGHYFGLYHTHGKINCGSITDELVNGSNCSFAGDDVCDTSADPGLQGIDCDVWQVNTACQYTGTFVDANGQPFDPDPTNIMSYSRKQCRDFLSNGQLGRASFYQSNYRNNLNCQVLCGPPTGLEETNSGYAFISLDWDAVPGATGYQTRYRTLGNTSWTEGLVFSTPGVTWGNIPPCSTYEFQVRADCGSGLGDYSSSLIASTDGCGDNYCYSYGISWDNWIEGVSMANLNNSSGNGFGYTNYTNLSATVDRGETYSITLDPERDNNVSTVYWRVWIDFNQDGDFADAGEQVVSTSGSGFAPVTVSLDIPSSASLGTTRMRVAMNPNVYPGYCATGNERDVEDYSVNIQGFNCTPPTGLTTSSVGYSHFQLSANLVQGADLYQSRVRASGSTSWTVGSWFTNPANIVWANAQPCTTYEVQIRSDCDGIFSDYSSSHLFTTAGCGDDYCYSYGFSWDQWIDGVIFSNLNNSSGNGYGYTNFTNLSAAVEQGGSYNIGLNAETDVSATTVYWRVWIDLNNDGDFNDSGEQVLSVTGNSNGLASGNIDIPASASLGTTRMRIAMSPNGYPSICGTGGNLDVEDYGLTISAPPCPLPDNFNIQSTGVSHVVLDWDNVTEASSYTTRRRKQGTTTWEDGNSFASSSVIWGNCEPCTTYEFQVMTNCSNSNSNSGFSNTITATTQGCGDSYCYSYGLSWDHWISGVNVASIANASGNGYGYTDYTNISANLTKGDSYTLNLTADTDVVPSSVYWRVWVDFNNDNDFTDAGEQVFSATGLSNGITTGSVNMPSTAVTGTTRMRVAMGRDNYSLPCETGSSIDVEDYTVNILAPNFFLNVTPLNLSFSSIGGSSGISLSSNTSWTVTDNASWISVTPSSDTGNNTLTVDCNVYTGLVPRTAEITIATTDGLIVRQVQVTQQPADPLLEINPAVLNFGANGGSASVNVTSNQDWLVGTPGVSWFQVLTTGGTGNGAITVQCNPNPNHNSRSATVTLTGSSGGTATLSVTQQGSQICGTPQALSATLLKPTRATVSWEAVSGATAYSLEVRLLGNNSWEFFTVATTQVELAGFAPCEFYEFRVMANCGNTFSVPFTFQTEGCGPYCDSYGTRNLQILD